MPCVCPYPELGMPTFLHPIDTVLNPVHFRIDLFPPPLHQVYVMSRHAVIAQEKMVPFEEALERKLLVPLSSIPPAATLLYVSHRWAAAGQPDTQDANAQMQVRRSKQVWGSGLWRTQ